jgi:hypothetical protein
VEGGLPALRAGKLDDDALGDACRGIAGFLLWLIFNSSLTVCN